MTHILVSMICLLVGFVVGTNSRNKSHDEQLNTQMQITQNLQQFLWDAKCTKIPVHVKYKGIDISHVVIKKGQNY